MEAKKRAANFSKTEIDTLIGIIHSYKDVVENKRTDATTWKEKNSAWESIANEFNAVSGNFPRPAKSIRAKYEGIKKDLRKKCARLKSDTQKTGGEISEVPSLTPFEEKVLSLNELSMLGLPSQFDSDMHEVMSQVRNEHITILDVPTRSHENNAISAIDKAAIIEALPKNNYALLENLPSERKKPSKNKINVRKLPQFQLAVPTGYHENNAISAIDKAANIEAIPENNYALLENLQSERKTPSKKKINVRKQSQFQMYMKYPEVVQAKIEVLVLQKQLLEEELITKRDIADLMKKKLKTELEMIEIEFQLKKQQLLL